MSLYARILVPLDGSDTDLVVRQSPVPVLLVRLGEA